MPYGVAAAAAAVATVSISMRRATFSSSFFLGILFLVQHHPVLCNYFWAFSRQWICAGFWFLRRKLLMKASKPMVLLWIPSRKSWRSLSLPTFLGFLGFCPPPSKGPASRTRMPCGVATAAAAVATCDGRFKTYGFASDLLIANLPRFAPRCHEVFRRRRRDLDQAGPIFVRRRRLVILMLPGVEPCFVLVPWRGTRPEFYIATPGAPK
jgi:hypothetical protein